MEDWYFIKVAGCSSKGKVLVQVHHLRLISLFFPHLQALALEGEGERERENNWVVVNRDLQCRDLKERFLMLSCTRQAFQILTNGYLLQQLVPSGQYSNSQFLKANIVTASFILDLVFQSSTIFMKIFSKIVLVFQFYFI